MPAFTIYLHIVLRFKPEGLGWTDRATLHFRGPSTHRSRRSQPASGLAVRSRTHQIASILTYGFSGRDSTSLPIPNGRRICDNFKVRFQSPLFRKHFHFLQQNSMFDRSSVRSTIPRTPSVPIIRSPHFAVARSGFILGAIALDTVPVLAHNVKTDADVGATFHIEPDHNPRAGETARAWFALTREGGELIPLAKCDCLLAVYDRAISETEPILTPTLQAIAAEEFRDIPGADIVFPQAGAYELEISGSPKEGESFSPFSLTYSVTVTPGTTPVASPATEANTTDETTPRSPSTTTNSTPSWGVPAIAIAILVVAGGFWWALKQFKSKES